MRAWVSSIAVAAARPVGSVASSSQRPGDQGASPFTLTHERPQRVPAPVIPSIASSASAWAVPAMVWLQLIVESGCWSGR